LLAGYELDLDISVARNTRLDKAANNPLGICLEYIFGSAGFDSITQDKLAAAERVLAHSMAQHSSMTPLAVAEFTDAVLEFAAQYGDEDEAEAAASRMTDMLATCFDSAEAWNSNELVWSAVICACGGPAYYPRAMQRLMGAVDELMRRMQLAGKPSVLVSQVLLNDVYEACQQLGEALLPELASVV
jgi:hypothetical protein